MKKPLGHVTEWTMTPEQLAEYLEKHPIRPSGPKKRREKAFDDIGTDYKWRGQKGAESRWGNA